MSFYSNFRNKISEVFDGFLSVVTSVGTSSDKAKSYQYQPRLRMSHDELDLVYGEISFAQKIINMLPDAAVSKWIDINHPKSTEINLILNDINKNTRFKGLKWLSAQLSKMSRLHKGAAIFWDVDDGNALDMPINKKTIKSFNGGSVIHAGHCWPVDYQNGIAAQYYWLYRGIGYQQIMVHVSRLTIDHNCSASEQLLAANNGWPMMGVLERCYDSMVSLIASYMKVGTILEDIITKTYGVDGLNDMLLDPDDTTWQKKLENQAKATSVIKTFIHDAKDVYSKMTTNVSGIPEMIAVKERAFAADSDTPYGKIFGEYAGGAFSNQGSTQDDDWDDKVVSHQEAHIAPAICYALDIVGAMMGEVEEIPFAFKPQNNPTQKEIAEVQLIKSQTNKNDIESGVLLPEEAANATYGGDEFSLQTKLDPALRAKKKKEEEQEDAQEKQTAIIPPNNNQNQEPAEETEDD